MGFLQSSASTTTTDVRTPTGTNASSLGSVPTMDGAAMAAAATDDDASLSNADTRRSTFTGNDATEQWDLFRTARSSKATCFLQCWTYVPPLLSVLYVRIKIFVSDRIRENDLPVSSTSMVHEHDVTERGERSYLQSIRFDSTVHSLDRSPSCAERDRSQH